MRTTFILAACLGGLGSLACSDPTAAQTEEGINPTAADESNSSSESSNPDSTSNDSADSNPGDGDGDGDEGDGDGDDDTAGPKFDLLPLPDGGGDT
ncbi:MAG TPA: hypothetical protein VM869_35250, partial [Enhygromyxa sp.]|nr:hypothetical protein [Enhygromyxa sp.]